MRRASTSRGSDRQDHRHHLPSVSSTDSHPCQDQLTIPTSSLQYMTNTCPAFAAPRKFRSMIHDFLLDFRRLRVFKSNFRRILSTTTNCHVSTHHWNFLTSSSLRAWKNLQRPFPLDSISSVFLLKPVKPRLESLTCRLALPLLVASSSASSDSLHVHSMWHKSY